ncbi:armadillo repeat-containing protein 7-like [Sycon ciliatum]|uniref:armadillo repeat-containing protein 7-like n=1 Tax=Sycon ciliatum TaxID=27933 RepID=UPI0031F611C0
MFSSQSYLDKKTGQDGFGRRAYLKQLVTEYQTTSNLTSKKELLANLSNFSYDPINFDKLKALRVPVLFVHCLSEEDWDVVELAAAGLCNVSADKSCAQLIDSAGGTPELKRLLSSSREAVVLAALTTLYYMAFDGQLLKSIADPEVMACVDEFATCKNPRLKNVAAVFLDHFPLRSKPQPVT